MNIPTINLARTGTNIVMLRKAAGLTVTQPFHGCNDRFESGADLHNTGILLSG